MSMNSKLSSIFQEVSDLESEEKSSLAANLRSVESSLDNTAQNVKEKLETSDFKLRPSQIGEIITKALDNLRRGL